MRRKMWVPLALGIVAAYIVLDRRATKYSDEDDDWQIAADKTANWGSNQRLKGMGRNWIGRLKEGVGRFKNDSDLVEEGMMDQATGAMRDTIGKAAHIASDTISDFNR